MIENFEKNEHVLAVKYFHENGKKFKNRKHFILTVLKVGQGKKNIFVMRFRGSKTTLRRSSDSKLEMTSLNVEVVLDPLNLILDLVPFSRKGTISDCFIK